jgi:hypothetical protein
MNRCLRLLIVLLLALVALAACRGDDTAEVATATPADLATGAPATAAPAIAATDTVAPLPTSTLLPTATAAPLPTATAAPTSTATSAAGAGQTPGQGQDGGAAATVAAAGQAQDLMGAWQSLIGLAVLNQTICATLQGLAQAGQQGGLGALAVPAGLLGVGQVLQSGQQQLGGLLNTPGVGQLLGSLQANQASISDVLTRWSGGQMDATAAGAALQTICSATDATLAQTQQEAQGAGLSQEQVGSMLDQSKRDAAGSLDGMAP